MTSLIYSVEIVTPNGEMLGGGVEWVKPGIGGSRGVYEWYIVDPKGGEYHSDKWKPYLSAQAALRALRRAAASQFDARATLTRKR